MYHKKLNGKTAWISGGTKGIGEGTAKLFAKEGANVVFTGRNETDANRILSEIKNDGGEAMFIKCDMTCSTDIKESIEKTISTYGTLDILVNNAGIVDIKPLHEYSEEDWDYVMDTNVKSMFLAFKYAFPYLKKQKQSYVVNVGSISSFVGQSTTPAYTTSKGAVLQLSRSIGLDYARFGIRSNCVCPGITDTPMLRQHIGKASDTSNPLKERLQRVPTGKVLTPHDIAKSILFFSCEDSAGIVATSLIIDGGYLACAEWNFDEHQKKEYES